MSTHLVSSPLPLFTQPELEAWAGFLGTFDRLNRLIEADLRGHSGLSHVEFEVLLRLARSPEQRLRIQALADASILTRSGMSRVIDRLEDEGLVQRQVADEDRRGAYAVLTLEGAQSFRTAAQAHASFVRSVFLGRFSEDELREMAGFWRRLTEPDGRKES